MTPRFFGLSNWKMNFLVWGFMLHFQVVHPFHKHQGHPGVINGKMIMRSGQLRDKDADSPAWPGSAPVPL